MKKKLKRKNLENIIFTPRVNKVKNGSATIFIAINDVLSTFQENKNGKCFIH